MPIEDFETRYLLGVGAMDDTHREFVELVNRLCVAGNVEFAILFDELERHTRAHFAAEDTRMQESGFPALREHRDEHQRVLGELEKLHQKVQRGSFLLARAYVQDQLPDWFHLHAMSMDSALAAHLLNGRPTVHLSHNMHL